MAYFRKLVGERCYLSPIDPDDAPVYTAWLNDADVAAGITFTRRVVNVAGVTRDARIKESKKYGLKRARRAPQYTKR